MKLPFHLYSWIQNTYRSKWMSRLAAIFGLSILFASSPAISATSGHTLKNIVLVHGAFVDGSSWAGVIERLSAMGYHVTSVQNPLTSLDDDVSATRNVLLRQKGDVLLVGHSWAGVVITQAGNASNVKGLVYLSALAPDTGESGADLLQRLHAPMMGFMPDENGFIWIDDPVQFKEVLAGDLPMGKVRLLSSLQQPIAAACFSDKVQHAAWREKPSWYLETTDDNALAPAVQQAIAKQIGAHSLSIRSSHLSLMSHPDAVAELIDKAARATAR